jgi:hypothetical protein
MPESLPDAFVPGMFPDPLTGVDLVAEVAVGEAGRQRVVPLCLMGAIAKETLKLSFAFV